MRERPRAVSTEESATILRLHHAEKWPVGTIATQIGRHHDTVERVRAQRDLWAFVMVLSYSRLRFLRFGLRAAMPSFLRGHVESFRFFASVPRVILYGRVGGRRGGVQEGLYVSAPFGWRCLTSLSIT